MAGDDALVGFVGLGNMGKPMAANIAAAGHDLLVYDAAGTEDRAPDGARQANGIAGVAAGAQTILLSLPDGAIVETVAREIIATSERSTLTVVDHSTIGAKAAVKVAALLADAGITYVDAPVSGGTKGAANATLAMMIAGPKDLCDALDPVLEPMAKNRFYVGDTPGQGQTVKVANNFLSATAMVATSEAIAFGEAAGLDPKVMVDVINASSGQNTATSDKFPNRILNDRYDAGFTIDLLTKDVRLYVEQVTDADMQREVGDVVVGVLGDLLADQPGADFTRIYPFVKARGVA